jgi:hypothetical protein
MATTARDKPVMGGLWGGGLTLTCAGACAVEERKQVVHRELLGIMQLRKDEYFQYLRHSRSSAVPSNLNKSTPPHTLAHTHTHTHTHNGMGMERADVVWVVAVVRRGKREEKEAGG